MNNTEILDLFRSNLREDVQLKRSEAGEIVLGGAFTKHFSVHFKQDEQEDEWAIKGLISLAKMVSGFPDDIQFYQLHDPLRGCLWDVIEDPEIVIRRYEKFTKELWTEPAPGVVSQKKWDDHIKIVYEIVFMFER